MKKIILLLTVFFAVTFTFANNTNDGRLTVYSNGNISIGEATRVVDFKGQKVTIYVSVDQDYNVSNVSLSDKISKEDFARIKAKFLAANCLTTCSKTNKCADKPTNFGVIGCYAECGIDCIDSLLQEEAAP